MDDGSECLVISIDSLWIKNFEILFGGRSQTPFVPASEQICFSARAPWILERHSAQNPNAAPIAIAVPTNNEMSQDNPVLTFFPAYEVGIELWYRL